MSNWFDKMMSDVSERYPWIVRYEDASGEVQQDQVSGESAQNVADYIRETRAGAKIYLIARIDNNWE